ncbi:HlyD family secretion protein [Paraburkholderia tagetis]|uniref:HlyD family secretion protein n=1 Tax=Paraburkholderia tagetis TaxID=2913261 RepID=A0A9X1UIR7_9BURK|nr:HlyD family secretion protein [Paraburkholderia tagetis]MCG5075337.1 HlyD family secretion protein [Paraburkholderia tagetis]
MSWIPRIARIAAMAAAIIAALCAIWYVWTYYALDPRTRNGHVRADVIGVTTDVSGIITNVHVAADQRVNKGDLLFQVDTERFTIAVERARANLESAQAALVYAQQQASRNRGLRGLVAQQAIDQSDSELRNARAAVDQARAALASANLDLKRSSVRAPVSGIVSYVDLRPGAFATPGQGMMALVDLDSLRVEGYFQETRLKHVHVDDRAQVQLMGDDKLLYGHVASITSAVNDSDTSIGRNLLPSISPNFAWVRLAQRIPVRVKLDPQYVSDALVPGRTATVVVLGPDRQRGQDGKLPTSKSAPGAVAAPGTPGTPGTLGTPGTSGGASDAARVASGAAAIPASAAHAGAAS